MQDKLKDFVDANRSAFDSVEAPMVLGSIQTALASKKAIVSSKLSKIMIKFTICASSIVATTLIVSHYLQTPASKRTLPGSSTVAVTAIDSLPKNNVENSLQNEATLSKQVNPQVTQVNAFNFSPLQTDTESSFPALSTITEPLSAAKSTPVQTMSNFTDTTYAGIKKLKLRIDCSAVELLKSSDALIHMQAYISESCNSTITMGRIRYSKSIARLKQEVNGSELSLWTEIENTKDRREVERDEKASKITLTVPENLIIEIENTSGSVMADGIGSQSMRLETHFGSITCTNVKGDISLIANSGSIKGQDISGQLKARTEFGSIKLDRLSGPIDINSSSGSVTLNDVNGNLEIRSTFGSQKINKVTGNIKSISSSGSVKMQAITGNIYCVSSFGTQFYEDIKGEISAQSSSGSVQLDKVSGKLNLSTSFGSIKGNNITLVESANLKASSGSIKLDFLNSSNELSYDLSSSSGSISVEQDGNKITGTDDLKIGTGKLIISGVTTFGSQSYKLVKAQ